MSAVTVEWVLAAASWPWEWSASAWSSLTFVMLVVAAGLTWRQVKEAQRVREDQSRPFVLIDFQHFSNIIEIRITNTGSTLARNVRFEFDPPLESADKDWKPAELNVFTSGIPSIAPRKEITLYFDQFEQRVKAGFPLTYNVQVSYSDAHGKGRYSEPIVLDLAAYLGTGGITRNGLHELHKELKSVADAVRRWTDSGGLKVLTPADIKARNAELLRRHEERRRRAEEAATEEDSSARTGDDSTPAA